MERYLSTSPLGMVLITVLLGIISATALKTASMQEAPLWVTILFVTAIAANFARFIIWGWVHKRYPVSASYPLASIFFPIILAVGHFFYGDPLNYWKIAGAILIMLGVGLLVREEQANKDKQLTTEE
jgi:multidrug transporter EmrE-like cation transporter